MVFTPFMQGTDAQSVINNYLGQNVSASTPMSPMDLNPHERFRNPYSPEGFYANETDMHPVEAYTPPVIDNEGIPTCEAGYVYDEILKSCVFVGYGESSQDNERDDREEEERDYFSIEEMKKLGDYELLKYLDDGWLKGDPYQTTIGGKWMPMQFSLPFGKQNEMRRDFIIQELQNRGYDMTTDDKGEPTFNLGNTLGIISNAESANLGGNRLATNQLSIFTPEEINYQIQAKKEADKVVQQGGNPFAKTMTEQQIIDDAKQSGGTVNPFEATMVASKAPPKKTKSTPSSYYMGGHHY